MKICLKCNIKKPLEDFGTRTRNSHGKRGRCKLCEIEDRKIYLTPERIEQGRITSRKWFFNHREEVRKKQLIWCKNNKEHRFKYQRKLQLQKRYGITQEQYDVMSIEQNHKCKICKSDNPGHNNKYFYVDHCHKTKIVRGLLCRHCNMAIGQFNDNAINIRRAADYVEFNGKL